MPTDGRGAGDDARAGEGALPPGGRGLTDGSLLTVAEVADALRVSRMTVYRLVHSGELPAVRVGRSYRVPEGAVAAFLAAAQTTPRPRTTPGAAPGTVPADEQRRAGGA